MKVDFRGTVKSISQFMGYCLDESVIDGITEQSTFENMRSDPSANPDSLSLGSQRTLLHSCVKALLVIGRITSVMSNQQDLMMNILRELEQSKCNNVILNFMRNKFPTISRLGIL